MKLTPHIALLFLLASMPLLSTAHASDNFIKPTKEELAMTELPGYPGVPAVVLFREEITRDDLHSVLHYDRVKILTEKGKEYANVELSYMSSFGNGSDDVGDGRTVNDVIGRTIHSDGTIIPFTGKPYKKVIHKNSEFSYSTLVFTLPDVEVGSIIEYRYATRINDRVYVSPIWYIQGELYVKSAHYAWYPTTRSMVSGATGNPINAVSWFPILPAGAKIDHRELASGGNGQPQQLYELSLKDVPPMPHEEFMPPVSNFTFRVLYNYTEYRSSTDYWSDQGKLWSKRVNSFADVSSSLNDTTRKTIAGANTPEEKLRKIYAFVQSLENTKYTRSRERQEDKAAGLGKISTASDVAEHKRGTPGELTDLFVAMARSAGLKAYAMIVPDRSQNLFTPMWLNMDQFDFTVAIVNYDGQDHFFDPGERYCPFEHLAWEHTFVSGIRQVDGGTDMKAHTPGDPYTVNYVTRVANLTMDEHGEVSGKVDLTFTGAEALDWRQRSLRGDEESVYHGLQTFLEHMLSQSMEVKVASIENLTEYEKPLAVHYEVKGPIGAPAGKRLIVPADFFVANNATTFPHEKREMAVYFQYPTHIQDAIRIKLPKNLTVEAVPDPGKESLPSRASYSFTVTSDPSSFTTRRSFIYGEVLVPPTDYPEVRTFYSKFESKDKETVVLKAASTAEESKPSGGMN